MDVIVKAEQAIAALEDFLVTARQMQAILEGGGTRPVQARTSPPRSERRFVRSPSGGDNFTPWPEVEAQIPSVLEAKGGGMKSTEIWDALLQRGVVFEMQFPSFAARLSGHGDLMARRTPIGWRWGLVEWPQEKFVA